MGFFAGSATLLSPEYVPRVDPLGVSDMEDAFSRVVSVNPLIHDRQSCVFETWIPITSTT
jgi:hypothetical protein